MSDEWHQKIRSIFEAALEREAQARSEFLKTACAGDNELLIEVQSLLDAHQQTGGPLDGPPLVGTNTPDRSPLPDPMEGRMIGPYSVIRKIGEGGMGIVYLAHRADGAFQRQCAIKLVRSDFASHLIAARFRLEREVLGSLDHPNIVRMIDAGETDDGLLYYVMEYVEGLPFDTYCDKHRLNISQRIELFRDVCKGVQCAHSNFIVHRDLKPSNILVMAGGTVKLLDFGIAKILDTRGESSMLATPTVALMTPEYASPEQLKGERITAATDVYLLGVVLYEVLTGHRPYRQKGGHPRDLERAICTDEPIRPSAVVSEDVGTVSATELSAIREGSVARLRKRLAADLDYILLKPLRKEPEQRYASAEQFDADLQRHLEGRPVLARYGTGVYRLRKFLFRHRLLVAAVASILVFLGITAAVLGYLTGGLMEGKSEALAQLARRASDDEFYDRAMRYATAALAGADNQFVDRVRINVAEVELRRALYASSAIAALHGHKGTVASAMFNRLGTRIVTSSFDQTARVWDAATFREIALLSGHNGRVWKADFSPDGTRIVTASLDQTARIWDAGTGRELLQLKGHSAEVSDATFSPDGRLVATASLDHTSRVWDARNGHSLAVLPHHDLVWSAAFSADGSRVVTASDKCAHIWNWAERRELRTLGCHRMDVRVASFSQDGTEIATASFDGSAAVWDAADGRQIALLRGHEGEVWSAAFSPDGTRVVTASKDGTARLWDSADGHEIAVFRGHEAKVWSAAFNPAGTRIVTASSDNTARVWSAVSSRNVVRWPSHYGSVLNATFSRDGTKVIAALEGKVAIIMDPSTGQIMTSLKHDGPVYSAKFSPNGSTIVTASFDHTARLWNAKNGSLIAVLQHAEAIRSAGFSADGNRVITASEDETASVWDAVHGRKIRTFNPCDSGSAPRGSCAMYSASFSPDGASVVTASSDGNARNWDVGTGHLIRTFSGHEGGLWSASFSPDGRHVLTSGNDHTARVWDTATGNQTLTLRGHTDEVWSSAYSPDGARIVTSSGGVDKTTRVWDAATGHVLAVLSDGDSGVWSAAFSPDGSRLVTGAGDGYVRIWQLTSALMKARADLLTQTCTVGLVSGLRLFSMEELGSAPVLDPAQDRDACEPPSMWARLWTRVRFSGSATTLGR